MRRELRSTLVANGIMTDKEATQYSLGTPIHLASYLEDIPIWPWILDEGGALDVDKCPDCWERNAHLERYAFACKALGGMINVLDFGCGVGYGTEMLVRAGCSVAGTDASSEALELAVNRRGELATFVDPSDPFMENDFGAVVAFEVIEHLEDPEAFLDWAQAKSPNLIISTPIVPTVGHNPFHKSDFTAENFRDMVSRRFEIKAEWTQTRPFRSTPSYLVLHGARRDA